MRSLLRPRSLLALTLLLGVLLCAVQTVMEPQRYTATVDLRILDDSQFHKMLPERPMTEEDKAEASAPAAAKAKELQDLLQNTLPTGFVDSVIERANLKRPVPLMVEVREPGSDHVSGIPNPRLDELRLGFSVRAVDSDVLRIRFTWDDREECEALLNAVKQGFMEDAGLSRQSESIVVTSFLKATIHRLVQQLKDPAYLRPRPTDGAAGLTVQKLRREVLEQQYRQQYTEYLQWERYSDARKVTALSQIVPLNRITAEPTVTPSHRLAEMPGRLLRSTALSLALVLAGAAGAALYRSRRFQCFKNRPSQER